MDSRKLEHKLEFLSAKVVALKHLRDEVVKRGGGGMEEWLKKVEVSVLELDEMQNELNELKKGGRLTTYSARRNLNKKLNESIDVVRGLEKEGKSSAESIHASLHEVTNKNPRPFSHADLVSWTSNFSHEVGFGGFGNVYKGKFPNGKQVAVKVLNEKDFDQETFMAEVVTMGGMASHRNLVKLHGYCFEDNMKALVYKYMENGSLEKVLYENHHNLKWEKLYGIAIEIAEGLAYLHDGCKVRIIHHDIKAANVLLDRTFSPKLTDFGLAKLMRRDKSHVTLTRTRGTRGYAAPEMWLPEAHISYKCDVYSFGMLLFEILGRRSNVEDDDWFPLEVWKKFERGQLHEIIQECDIIEKDRENAMILCKVALWCGQYHSLKRPDMSTVVKMLQKKIPVTTPPKPFPSWMLTNSLMLSSQDEISEQTDGSLGKERFQEREEDSIIHEEIASTSIESLKSTSSVHLDEARESEKILESFDKKCPLGGESSVILYTTRMRGVRKTFEDCNNVRRILESHGIMIIERDLFTEWDEIYKQQLKNLLGRVQIPALFVKGRFIGGAKEVSSLNEEGTLEILLYGIPKAGEETTVSM
ncbi:hypothetical protein AQUCO_08300046v1 [Aquilegia coerulea]|uniref:Protein kinase domain-containing protein n=1 Tax=Aquilegia coerulea TaxID=218851 RepID=A0A2G5C766_AQUCA|nr:hypothetical protein AQUCO_08300046v1 [Aquilegia coerulea]PIA27081.1 hypothetical protein AQUCO_08300046v1 [Aquilegia coerulea]